MTLIGRLFVTLLLGASSLAVGPVRAAAPAGSGIVVFAAASLSESLQALADRYQHDTGTPVRISFAASGTLARQIEAGAHADVFLSADAQWMDYLAERHLIDAHSRHDLLLNRLVLIAPADSKVQLRLGPGVPVVAALGGGRLALADPDSVPAGRYAKQAFVALGVWDRLEPVTVRAQDVRAALLWVARGEAPLGVVYATDARVEPRVRVVDTFPASTHAPIVYPVAVTSTADPAAAAFARYLDTGAARAEFEARGFALP